MSTWPSPRSERLGTPNSPAIRFARGTYFGASWFTHLLRPVRLLAPLYGSDWNAQPTGASTSRLSTDRSPSPLLDMTTTATGLLCWRDSHPPEWQLASLHQIRTCGIPAYGSYLGCLTANRCCGYGWRIRAGGSQWLHSRLNRDHVIRLVWLRRLSRRIQSHATCSRNECKAWMLVGTA